MLDGAISAARDGFGYGLPVLNQAKDYPPETGRQKKHPGNFV